MARTIQGEQVKRITNGGRTEEWLEVTDEFGHVHFVAQDPLNRDYRAVLEFRRGRDRVRVSAESDAEV